MMRMEERRRRPSRRKRRDERRGEKAGWIGGWLGGLAWMVVPAAAWFREGKAGAGTAVLGLLGTGVLFAFLLAPWRFPRTRYGVLMAPLYAVFFAALATCFYMYGGVKRLGYPWVSIFALFPCLLPLALLGGRTWSADAGEEGGEAGTGR